MSNHLACLARNVHIRLGAGSNSVVVHNSTVVVTPAGLPERNPTLNLVSSGRERAVEERTFASETGLAYEPRRSIDNTASRRRLSSRSIPAITSARRTSV